MVKSISAILGNLNPLNFLSGTLAFRANVYGYSNARIRALKSSLLDRKFFDELIKVSNSKELLNVLQRTAYKEDLSQASLDTSNEIDLIEFSLVKNLHRNIKLISKISPKQALPVLNTIFERYDLLNLKTILLSNHLNKENKEIKKLLIEPINLSQAKLNELIEKDSVQKTVNVLKSTEYFFVLYPKLKKYSESNEIQPLLQALDVYYFQKLSSNISLGFSRDERIIYSLIKSEIDAKNIMNILRLKTNEVDKQKIKELLIPNGNIKLEFLQKLVAEKEIQKIVIMLKSYYDLSDALEEFQKDSSLIHFELALENLRVKKALSALRRSVLSIGTIYGFLYLKEQEILNIKKVLRAKEFNLSKEETEKMLVFESS